MLMVYRENPINMDDLGVTPGMETHISIYLSIHPSIYLSIYLSISISISISFYIYIRINYVVFFSVKSLGYLPRLIFFFSGPGQSWRRKVVPLLPTFVAQPGFDGEKETMDRDRDFWMAVVKCALYRT